MRTLILAITMHMNVMIELAAAGYMNVLIELQGSDTETKIMIFSDIILYF
jgi:hypothetical protein